MFQPQPTPFSTFFPAYLPAVEDLAVRDDGNGVGARVTSPDIGFDVHVDLDKLNSYSHSPAHPSFNNYHHHQHQHQHQHQQTTIYDSTLAGACGLHQAAQGQGRGRGPSSSGAAGPGGPVLGRSGAPTEQGQEQGQGQAGEAVAGVAARVATGVPVVPTAPLRSVFPLHSAIPQTQQRQPAGASNLFDHNASSFRQPHHHFTSSSIKMEPNSSLQDELAAQEAAARSWQPELEGPRVGEKTPIAAITDEYAKADPVYVAKTMALPQTYTHYRPVKGDGNCGWRAIGFCYFELLIQQGNRELVEGEQLRLTQLNDYLVNSGGFDPDIFLDFTEDTFQLFKDIADNIHTPDIALAILTSTFNADTSMSLIYHLRLLAASQLKGERDQYEAWCERGVDIYSREVIEIPEREIEELGIVLLVEILLKPVGFTLEIAYLDRSAGTEVNTHRFPDTGASLGPFIHLLYRPGHYDILYKPSSTDIQVNRMSFEPATFSSVPHFPATFDFNPLAMIPGAATIGPLSPMGQLGGPSLDFSSSPQSPWYPPFADASPTPPSQPQKPQQITTTTQAVSGSAVGTAPTHEIRFSSYQYEQAMDSNAWSEQPVQTNMFKNSHFNTAHYNNPNFQPEEYRPGADEDLVGVRSDRSGRKRSYAKNGHHSSDDSVSLSDMKQEK